MPNYDYVCTHCGYREEILQKITEEPLKECPQCRNSTFKRKFGTGAGLQFHGSGFYLTDYAPKPSSGQESPPSAEDNKSSGCGCGKSSCQA